MLAETWQLSFCFHLLLKKVEKMSLNASAKSHQIFFNHLIFLLVFADLEDQFIYDVN